MLRKATGGAITGALWGLIAGIAIGAVAAGFIQPLFDSLGGDFTQWAVDIGTKVGNGITEDIGRGLGQSVTGALLGAVGGTVIGALVGCFHRLYYAEF